MTLAASETRTLTVERDMPHPPQKIWRALMLGALIEDWLMKTDFEPVVGRRFSFRTDPMPHWDGVVEGEVLEVEAPTRLVYRWQAGIDTIVTWTLTPSATGTMVRMEQSGFRPAETQNFQGALYGWQRNIAKLEDVAARA